MRVRLIALLTAMAVTPAVGQVMMQPVQRPGPLPNLTVQQDPDAARKITTLEDAQAQIAKLRAEKRELDARLAEALATIDSWTKKGGSLVHAYCESETMSRTSAGASEDCSNNGYRCAPVEGTCRRSCNSSDECAGGNVCDTGAHVCVRA
jgi:hypothetical protein